MVDRYDVGVTEGRYGSWVSFEDYEELEKEKDSLEQQADSLQEQVDKLSELIILLQIEYAKLEDSYSQACYRLNQ